MLDEKVLILSAIEARKSSYTPYSNFKVGAALLTKDGKIYQGCNIECASYTPTTCAERTALLKAVSEGHREFSAIAVVGGPDEEIDVFSNYAAPCGVCRQYLREFCNPKEMKVIIAKSENESKTFTLEELLPVSFGPDNLK